MCLDTGTRSGRPWHEPGSVFPVGEGEAARKTVAMSSVTVTAPTPSQAARRAPVPRAGATRITVRSPEWVITPPPGSRPLPPRTACRVKQGEGACTEAPECPGMGAGVSGASPLF